jgi:hypothetical protein
MSKIKPHCFGQVCTVELCKGVLGFGKLGVNAVAWMCDRWLALTLNPRNGHPRACRNAFGLLLRQ